MPTVRMPSSLAARIIRRAISPRLAMSKRRIGLGMPVSSLRQGDQHLNAKRANDDGEDAFERTFRRAVRQTRAQGSEEHATDSKTEQGWHIDVAQTLGWQSCGAPAVDNVPNGAKHSDGEANR